MFSTMSLETVFPTTVPGIVFYHGWLAGGCNSHDQLCHIGGLRMYNKQNTKLYRAHSNNGRRKCQ